MGASVTGLIFDIQKFSIHDGPGIRTTVFVKGCPLRCSWCHNPESNLRTPQLSFLPDRCIGCGYCFRVCPQHAHLTEGDTHTIDRNACRSCGLCTRECYAEALELIGREATVADVLAEVLRDKPFYETSGGGMTISGGEPLMQPAFTGALLQAAKEAGLHCCVETSGFADYHVVDEMRASVDLWLYDLKETDSERHRAFTGVPLEPVLDNLSRLHADGDDILLRCPIIPGCNDRQEHFQGIADIAARLTRLQGVELMPYHRLGEGKLERLGLDGNGRAQAEAPEPEQVREWVEGLRALGVTVVNELPDS